MDPTPVPHPTDPPLCVHGHPDPTHCALCRSLARCMGLLGSQPVPMGWYTEEVVSAWGRAVGVKGPLFFIDRMQTAYAEAIEARNLTPTAQ